MGAKRILGFVAGAFYIVAWALYIAGNATVTWSVYSLTVSGITSTGNYGLWGYTTCNPSCSSFSYSCDSSSSSNSVSSSNCAGVNVGRAFVTIACIITLIPGVLLIIISITQKYIGKLLWSVRILGILSFLTGLVGLVAGMVTTAFIGSSHLSALTNLSYSIGAGGGVSIVGVFLSFVALLLCACVRKDKDLPK